MEQQPAPDGYDRFEPPGAVEQRPSTLDERAYDGEYQAYRQFGIGRYDEPEGFRYQRFRHGEFLSPLFFARQYWLTDFWLFGLAIPPIGYEWVRYGPDALLVNLATGRIVQVVYGAFFY